MPRSVYNQNNCSVSFNGIALQGFAEGDSIVVDEIGGEAELTEGTDGAALNIATRQGIKVTVTLRETSPSITVLDAFRELQQRTGATAACVVRNGANTLYALVGAAVSKPGASSTGGKKMGSTAYDIVAAEYSKT
jgi:hypothetical protein